MVVLMYLHFHVQQIHNLYYTKLVVFETQIEDIKKWIRENNITNHVFLFSASTFTNLAVYELFRDFPNNSYIDIGTCLTPMMNMPTHRGYLEAFWGYRGGQDIQKICIWN